MGGGIEVRSVSGFAEYREVFLDRLHLALRIARDMHFAMDEARAWTQTQVSKADALVRDAEDVVDECGDALAECEQSSSDDEDDVTDCSSYEASLDDARATRDAAIQQRDELRDLLAELDTAIRRARSMLGENEALVRRKSASGGTFLKQLSRKVETLSRPRNTGDE
jgi:chromosome segregation ATPase